MADIPRSPAGSEAGSLYEGSSGKGPTPLVELSKEELIQRCKKLLQIAQKAKAAKDGKTLRIINYMNQSFASAESTRNCNEYLLYLLPLNYNKTI